MHGFSVFRRALSISVTREIWKLGGPGSAVVSIPAGRDDEHAAAENARVDRVGSWPKQCESNGIQNEEEHHGGIKSADEQHTEYIENADQNRKNGRKETKTKADSGNRKKSHRPTRTQNALRGRIIEQGQDGDGNAQ